MVARSAIGEACEARTEELDELADHAALAQHLRHGQHEVGRGHAFLELAGELEADHLGQKHRVGLAEHRGFRLDAADAPAEHRKAVDHGGVRVGADQRVGIGDLDGLLLAVDLDLVRSPVQTVCDRYSRLTWWQMPVPGGTTRKFSNERCAHFRNL